MEYPGKKKCEALKSVRREIAKANGIEYAPHPCTHEGDCPGTCPACEAEVKYLECAIAKKHGSWSKAKGAAVAASIVLAAGSLTSCSKFVQTTGTVPREGPNGDVIEVPDSAKSMDSAKRDSTARLRGSAAPNKTDSIIELLGEAPIEMDSIIELEGDVPVEVEPDSDVPAPVKKEVKKKDSKKSSKKKTTKKK